jgi:hypothetical protein
VIGQLCTLLILASSTVSAEPFALTADEFKMYRQYTNAMEDPRVQAMKPDARMPAIAKDAGFKLKELKAAIAKGESAGDLKSQCDSALKEGLSKSSLGNRVGKVDADLSQPHAIAYVSWLNENPAWLEEEAAELAALSAKACPIVSSIQVWANDKQAPQSRVFQGLVSRTAADNIKVERAKDFADTRYIRLFEKVKSVAKGDDLSGETGAPAANP